MKQQARKSDRNFKGNEQKTILILLLLSFFLSFGAAGIMLLNELSII